MNSEQRHHYERAEELLRIYAEHHAETPEILLVKAQVHATLAIAASGTRTGRSCTHTPGEGVGQEGEAMTPTQAVVHWMRALRKSREWSGARLAREMTEIGVAWNRGVVAKLETGRRETVSVDELVALARAFNVSPLTPLSGVAGHSRDGA
jgi:hypothetical protein